MNMGEIIKDSLRYPFSDWKKILILGIIVLITGLDYIFFSLSSNVALILLFVIITWIIAFFARGYQFRIIKSSLSGVIELPEFNAWRDMFVDGIKVFIVTFVYLIPAILIIVFAGLSFGSTIINFQSPLSSFDLNILVNVIILALIAILYTIIILPIDSIAIAHMANNDSELSSAFRFYEILDKISTNGWINLIVWYIVTGILFLILLFIGSLVTNIIGRITFPIVGTILISLTVMPYLFMFLSRSVALFYMSK
jgi:hypothetical protein